MDGSGFFFTVILAFEVLGVVALCAGFVVSAWLAIRSLRRGEGGTAAFLLLRKALGGTILLGLEIFVAADIIRTIYTPTVEEALILALIVAIRTVLSMSIQIEIEGVAPWRRALLTTGAGVLAGVITGNASGEDRNPRQARDGEAG